MNTRRTGLAMRSRRAGGCGPVLLCAACGKLSAAARKTLYGKQPDADGQAGGDKKPRPKK